MQELKINEIEVGTRRSIDPTKVHALADSIKEVGLLNPITVDKHYRLIAGAHRLEAFKLLGRESIVCNVVDLTGLYSELAEIDENLVRNELHYIDSDEQIARRKDIYEELHPQTVQTNKGGSFRGNQYTQVVNDNLSLTKDDTNNNLAFAEDTALKTGESKRNIERAVQRAINLIPEIKKTAKAMDLPKTEATKIARLEPETQLLLVPKLEQGLTVEQSLSTIKREQRQTQIELQLKPYGASVSVDIHSTDNKYRIIYADPPWSYNDKCESGGVQSRGADGVYPTMSITDICNLPIKDICETNAALFLWVTSPLLEDSFRVINAWGFKYKSSFVWDKVLHNMGHYNSVRHELLLICTRGSCTPDNNKLIDSVQSIERTEHSKKPNEFREIIDTLYPYGKRIELFSREKAEGWDVMGNMV